MTHLRGLVGTIVSAKPLLSYVLLCQNTFVWLCDVTSEHQKKLTVNKNSENEKAEWKNQLVKSSPQTESQDVKTRAVLQPRASQIRSVRRVVSLVRRTEKRITEKQQSSEWQVLQTATQNVLNVKNSNCNKPRTTQIDLCRQKVSKGPEKRYNSTNLCLQKYFKVEIKIFLQVRDCVPPVLVMRMQEEQGSEKATWDVLLCVLHE